jgi:hypothetical protein
MRIVPIMRRRNGLIASVIGMLLPGARLATPHLQTGRPFRYRARGTDEPLAAAPYPASGLVPWHIAALDKYGGMSAAGQTRHASDLTRTKAAIMDRPPRG